VQPAVSIEQSYNVPTTVVVVLPPPGSVVEVGTVVVVVDVLVELGVVEVEVETEVVVLEHGQLSVAGRPTTDLRQIRASVAVVGRVPLGAQMHSGSQLVSPTTTRRT
jgi:hypothetical protein